MTDDRHLERVLSDPPAESDILGHPIDGNGKHRLWRAVGIAVIVACGVVAIGTVTYVAFVFGIL